MAIKYKTTDREQRKCNVLVIKFGYCEIRNIESFLDGANAYTHGFNGWHADFYNLNGFTISTGYQPLKYIYKSSFTSESKLTKMYDYIEKKILKLENDLSENGKYYNLPWSKRQAKVKKILDNLMHDARKKFETKAI